MQGGANLAIPITSRRENFGAGVGDITLNLSGNWSNVSDFGTVNDWSAGITWGPTEKLSLGASYIVNQEAPSISQLGNPLIQSFNVPVYDFSRGETVLVTDRDRVVAELVPPRESRSPLLADALLAQGQTVHLIGGAHQAGELDAKRAIDQAARLAAAL